MAIDLVRIDLVKGSHGNDTTIISHHLYTLCHLANYALCCAHRRVVEGSGVGIGV